MFTLQHLSCHPASILMGSSLDLLPSCLPEVSIYGHLWISFVSPLYWIACFLDVRSFFLGVCYLHVGKVHFLVVPEKDRMGGRFWHTSFIGVCNVCAQAFPYFLALQDTPCPSCVFPVPVLESAISARNLGSFCWRNQDLALVCVLSLGLSWF